MSKITVITKCSVCPDAAWIEGPEKKRIYIGCGLLKRAFDWKMIGMESGTDLMADWCPLPSLSYEQAEKLGLPKIPLSRVF